MEIFYGKYICKKGLKLLDFLVDRRDDYDKSPIN